MTQQELNIIVEAVISALMTSGKTLLQLTTVTEIDENDYLELDGGRKVSFATLRDLIISSAGVTGDVVDYDDRDEISTFTLSIDSGRIALKQRGRTQKTVTIPLATTTKRGLMSPADLSKLNYAYDKVINDIPDELDGKVSVESFTSAFANVPTLVTIKYRIRPDYEGFVTLASMGANLDNIDGGDFVYTRAERDAWYEPRSNRIYFWQEGAPSATYRVPSEEVLYYNSHTGRAYRWTGSMMKEAFCPTGPSGRLDSSYVMPSVLSSMGRALDNVNATNVEFIYTPNVGDYYFDGDSIKYMTDSGAIDIGLPQKELMYCNAHTDLIYRWNGTNFVRVQ